jgi:hypothetical protein
VAIQKPIEILLDFLDSRVFTPTAGADPGKYASAEDRKLLKSVKKRVAETRTRYLGSYATARDVKVNFAQDLQSKPGQALASDMLVLKLKRFEDVRQEFADLCQKLGV